MKKFTLYSALAALATVGSVFAAWTFTEGGNKNLDQQNLGITVDDQIKINGLNGDATVVFEDEPTLIITQGNDKNAITKVDVEGDDIVVTYTPVTYEQTSKIKITYTISFNNDSLSEWFDDSSWKIEQEVNIVGGTFEDTLTATEIADIVVGKSNAVDTSEKAEALIDAVQNNAVELEVNILIEDASN